MLQHWVISHLFIRVLGQKVCGDPTPSFFSKQEILLQLKPLRPQMQKDKPTIYKMPVIDNIHRQTRQAIATPNTMADEKFKMV